MNPATPLPPPTTVPPGPFSREDQVRRPPLSGRELVAIGFASAILVIIAGISIFLLRTWHAPLPLLNTLPPESQAAAIERYKDLTSVLGDRTEKMFDLMITKALLPVFATLIGYLLGKRSDSE